MSDPRPARRLIIMPAYNEAGNLPRVIPEVRAAAPGYDLLVVNDGSRDRTAEVAAHLGATVVTLPVNLGYGGAVQTGFRYAVRNGYDLAVVIDAEHGGERQTGFGAGNAALDDEADRHAAQFHAQQVDERDRRAGEARLDPDVDERDDDDEYDQRDNGRDDDEADQ